MRKLSLIFLFIIVLFSISLFFTLQSDFLNNSREEFKQSRKAIKIIENNDLEKKY